MSPPFRLRAGDNTTRAELVVEYGGSAYSGGIVPSRRSNSVFVFTDPAEGTQFGYVYDGFAPDHGVLHYTGAGQSGDQRESGSNSPILTAVPRGGRYTPSLPRVWSQGLPRSASVTLVNSFLTPTDHSIGCPHSTPTPRSGQLSFSGCYLYKLSPKTSCVQSASPRLLAYHGLLRSRLRFIQPSSSRPQTVRGTSRSGGSLGWLRTSLPVSLVISTRGGRSQFHRNAHLCSRTYTTTKNAHSMKPRL